MDQGQHPLPLRPIFQETGIFPMSIQNKHGTILKKADINWRRETFILLYVVWSKNKQQGNKLLQ
jgi:hypothetical protein